jgi:hypothetical protein
MTDDKEENKSTGWMIDDTPIDVTEKLNGQTKEEIMYAYLVASIKAAESVCKNTESTGREKRLSKKAKKIDYSKLTLDEFEPIIESKILANQPKELLAFYKAWLKRFEDETPIDKLARIIEEIS